MAKLTPDQWKLAKADYEVQNISIRDVAKKYSVNASTVSRQAKKENWQQGKTQRLVEKKVNAVKELHETQQQMQHLDATTQQAINYEVSQRLLHEKIFINSALRNQEIADELLEQAAEMSELNQHSQLTLRNKETVLGKQPDTAIQINNQVNAGVQPLTPDIARAINAKLEDEY